MLIACQRICGEAPKIWMNPIASKQQQIRTNFSWPQAKSVDKHVRVKFGCLFAPKTVHRTTTSRVGSLASVKFNKLPAFVLTKHLLLRHFLTVLVDAKSASSSINLNASLLFHSQPTIAHAKHLKNWFRPAALFKVLASQRTFKNYSWILTASFDLKNSDLFIVGSTLKNFAAHQFSSSTFCTQ